MTPKDTMQFDYQMKKSELAEMCARALGEVLRRQKVFLTFVLITVIYGLLSIIKSLTRSGSGHIFIIITPIFTFLLLYYIVLFLTNYRHYIKAGLLNPQRLRLENGYLITGLDGTGHFPCQSYTEFKNGRRIIMIGTRNSARITSYIGIPKRVFSCVEEQNAFLWLMQNSIPSESGNNGCPPLDRGGDILLRFDITPDRWAHIYGEVVQILTDKSLLGKSRSMSRYLIIGLFAFLILQRAVFGNQRLSVAIMYLIIFLAVSGLLLFGGNSKTSARSSDMKYRNLLAQGKIQSDTLGLWEMGIRPDEGYCYHNERYLRFPWAEYCQRFDMGDTLFFFHKNGKQYLFIPKEALGTPEQTARFYDYFYQKGMQFQTPTEEAGWNSQKITGVILLSVAATVTALSIVFSMTRGMMGIVNQDYAYNSQISTEETTPFVFRPEDYPDYTPLAVQIEVLKSLGIEPPSAEEMKQYEEWMEEDDYYRAYIEGTPYTGILSEMGTGTYDETTEEYSYHPSVYWFDFEGWDISEDYLDILKAFHVMGDGDFELTDLKEDLQNVNWEEGTGAILVMFRYNKHAYAFEAQMMYDWIDPDIIGFFNEVLEKEKNPKRIYYMYDEGQGAILFYNTKAWANEFYLKTGIQLEALTRSREEPWIPTNGPDTGGNNTTSSY